MITSKLIEFEGGYSYQIMKDDIPFIVQDYHPQKSGFVVMTKEEAEGFVAVLVDYFKGVYDDNN